MESASYIDKISGTAIEANAINALGNYPDYMPVNESGGKEGCILRSQNGWRLSTDVGCLFISLDGIEIINPANSDKLEEFANAFYEILAYYF